MNDIEVTKRVRTITNVFLEGANCFVDQGYNGSYWADDKTIVVRVGGELTLFLDKTAARNLKNTLALLLADGGK